MKRWTRLLTAAGSGAAGAAAAVAVGSLVWDRMTARAVTRLLSPEKDLARHAVSTFAFEELEGLPAPVARYFRFALTPGQRIPRQVRVAQSGEFRTAPHAAWSPFKAVQQYTADPPGFVWDARIRMSPFFTVRVRDSYIHGKGAMEARLASLFPIVSQSGQPELAAGALHRYLAEAVTFPTALLPSQGVRWQGIDTSAARATLTDAGISVSLDFQFGGQGEIVRAYTPERYRDVQGVGVKTPWACYYRDYEWIEGIMRPRVGEVEWILPDGPFPYCRQRLETIKDLPVNTTIIEPGRAL